MDPMTAMFIIGQATEQAGNVFTGISNFFGSRRREQEMRTQIREQSDLLQDQVGLARDRLRGDNNLQRTQQMGQLAAGSAASGVRGSSGSVQAVGGEIRRESARQLDLGMRSIDIDLQRGINQLNQARRAADEEKKNRRWQLAADLLGFGTTGAQGAGQFMNMMGPSMFATTSTPGSGGGAPTVPTYGPGTTTFTY